MRITWSGYKPYQYNEPNYNWLYIENVGNETGKLYVDTIDPFEYTRQHIGGKGYYSFNKSVWSEIPVEGVSVEAGEKVYIKNSGGWSRAAYYYGLSFDKTFIVGGNSMSLIYGDDTEQTTLNTDYCFMMLFINQTNLLDSSNMLLPATTLTIRCYAQMFQGCTSMVAGPQLNAETLTGYCYMSMFRNCSSLVHAPVLGAKTLVEWCYGNMFYGCSSLKDMTVGFTQWAGSLSATDSWVGGVSGTGTFTCPSTLEVRYDTNYIPSGWTVEKYQEVNESI